MRFLPCSVLEILQVCFLEMDTTKGVLGFSFAGTTSKQQVKELKSRKSDYIHEALQQIEMAKSAGSAACDEIVAQGGKPHCDFAIPGAYLSKHRATGKSGTEFEQHRERFKLFGKAHQKFSTSTPLFLF